MAAVLNAVAAGAKPGGAAAEERATRSVFVGNIPYEATEEQLKEIFMQAGTVISFRLVYDRETGKPKGYGFCEYQDLETAQSAMRNLNNHDFNGRPLRVGVAAGEQSKDENKSLQQAIGGPLVESPYGEPCSPEDAPEAISKAVASLPPEQMFELMKQMKLCIQNNPNEARNMLQQNPQLAYALLQGQIVMKIVDPPVALAMLHRQTEQIPPLLPSSQTSEPTPAQDVDHRIGLGPGGVPPGMNQSRPPAASGGPGVMGENRMMPGPGGLVDQEYGRPGGPVMGRGGLMEERPEGLLGHAPMDDDGMGGPRGFVGDPRDPRASRDMVGRGPPGPMNRGDMGGFGGRPGLDMGPRSQGPRPRGPGPQGMRPQGPGPQGPRPQGGRPDFRDPRQGGADPRTQRGGMGPQMRPGAPGGGVPGMAGLTAGQDQEKAALIMQVLQLSDEQISLLPPDQRQSILILKEQIARAK